MTRTRSENVRAFKAPVLMMIGLTLLAAPVPTFAAGCAAASEGQGFANKEFGSIEMSQFGAEFDSTPTALGESLIGISDGSQSAENYAVVIRFNSDGFIDALNGDSYAAAAKIAYSPGVMYHFTLQVDVSNHKYSVYVTPPSSMTPPKGTKMLLARNFGFRSSQSGVFSLHSVGVGHSGEGSVNACNLTIASIGGHAPISGAQDLPLNPNCTLIVPDNPLSAAGLATPYQLFSADPMQQCDEANGATGAFVAAAIYNPAGHTISVYNPLVINQGTTPAVAPTPPSLPAGAIVALWFGFDGTNLLLQASSPSVLTNANCVNGEGASLFSQYAYCNAVAFFAGANADPTLIASIPALGISPKDNKLCPSPRDFSVVDQDPSDNLPTTYLVVTATGQLAQDTAANRALIGAGNFSAIGNPSDEKLTAQLLGPALGCTAGGNGAWVVPDLADPGHSLPSLPTNELQSAKFGPTPAALVPANDPMAQNGGNDLNKVNLYRAGVDQPMANTLADADPVVYCRNFRATTPLKLLQDKPYLVVAGTPAPTVGDSLFTFLAARYVASYSILGCQTLLNQPVNMILTINGSGVVINARGLTR